VIFPGAICVLSKQALTFWRYAAILIVAKHASANQSGWYQLDIGKLISACGFAALLSRGCVCRSHLKGVVYD